MSYTKITSFTPKDTLLSGNPNKLVRGSELDAEFDAIAAAYSNVDNTSDATKNAATATLTNKTLVAPVLGAATATSVNKVSLTAPATGSTLTIADGKTLTVPLDATVSGTNTGDQTNISGNAATATSVAVGGITGLGTGVATALAVNVGSAGAPVVNGGAGGTPSSITLTNATGTAASLTAGLASGLTGTPNISVGTVTASSTINSTGTLLQATPGANSWGINVQRDAVVNRAGWKYDYATDKVYIWSAANASAPELTLYNGLAVTGTLSATGFTLDASGNLGLGVTPSAWGSGSYKAVQVGGSLSFMGRAGGSDAYVMSNTYFDQTNYRYTASLAASRYTQSGGEHQWYTAPSGTAGNAVTFTQSLAVGLGTTLALQGATSVTGCGITFPATQNASADANTLDDYDEYTAASAACTGAITTAAVWKLTKVGNLVTLTLPSVLGTASTATKFVFGTVIPSKFRPSTDTLQVVPIKDGGVNQAAPGAIYVTSVGGAVAVYAATTFTANFTSGDTSGLAASVSISWTI